MTTRTLINCPVCGSSTKVSDGVLCCIGDCRMAFWSMPESQWYLSTGEELQRILADSHLKDKAISDFRVITTDLRKTIVDMGVRHNNFIEGQMTVASTYELIMGRVAEIAWERGVKWAGGAPSPSFEQTSTIVDVAKEEIGKEYPEAFKHIMFKQ